MVFAADLNYPVDSQGFQILELNRRMNQKSFVQPQLQYIPDNKLTDCTNNCGKKFLKQISPLTPILSKNIQH